MLVLIGLLLVMTHCAQKKAPVTEPVKDPRADDGEQFTMSAEKLAKEAQFRSSNFLLRKAISLYSEIKHWEKAIRCHISMADNFQKLEDFENARRVLSDGLEMTRSRLGYKHLELARSFQKMGFKFLQKKEYDKAVEMYDKALYIQLEILGKDHPEVARTYNSIALAYWNKQDPHSARANYNKSFSIKLRQFQGIQYDVKKKYKLLEPDDVKKQGFARARNYFNRSLAVYRDTYGPNDPLFAAIYENIGILYAMEGDYDRSLEYLRKSFAIRLDLYGDQSPELATNYHNLGICLRLKGEDDDALRFLNDALEIHLKEGGKKDNPDTADIYYQLGKIHLKADRFDKALSHFQDALIAVSPGFTARSVHKNPEPGRVFAEDRLLKILAAKAETLRMRYYHNLSRVNDLKTSFNTYLLVTDLIGSMRRGYKSESYKLFFGEKSHDLYDEAIQTALLYYDVTDNPRYRNVAFILSEKSKAAVLEESLAESRARRFAGIPDQLLKKEGNLRQELSLYDTLLEKEYQAGEAADPRRVKKLENRYFELRTRYRELIDRFETHYPGYFDLKYNPNPVTVESLQRAMSGNMALIEYFVGRDLMYIFVLTRRKLEVISLPADRELVLLIDQCDRSIKTIVERDFSRVSRRLYDRLIDPVRPLIRNKRKLVIIPHGRLFYVPFEALTARTSGSKDFSRADYMIKHYDFSYHYSAGLWLHTVKDKPESRELSFIGFAPVFNGGGEGGGAVPAESPPVTERDVIVEGVNFSRLPGAEQEVRAIIDLFKARRKQAVGYFHGDASEDRFKSSGMRDYSIIHVATHSLKADNNPKLSGLIFTQEQAVERREDGILYSGEMFNLNLDAELIVLSSCESGIGKLVKGEGMIALNRGFLYSGVRNTIFSLWKVEDKTTSRLMVELYRGILEGRSYAAALRRAKLKLIRDPFTAFPRYWSGFILVGE